MRKMKCKYCGDIILNIEDLFSIFEKTSTGIEKKVNLHQYCCNEYIKLIEYKKYEVKWFNEIYEHIKELLLYTSEQKLPKFLIVRIQDLRNGTIIERGIGRVNKSKEGYPYQIILDTFLDNGDAIRWSFANKTFKTENQKINYMMAIIDSNINNNYISFKNQLETSEIKQRDNIIEEEQIIENNIQNNLIIQSKFIPKQKNGISSFLNDDEL